MRKIWIAIGVVMATATAAAAKPACKAASRDVKLVSADKVAIHGTFSTPCDGEKRPIVVLAHQMCQTRAEWSDPAHDWVGALAARGVATLAIDLRGHGASTQFGWAKHDLCKERDDALEAGEFPKMVDDVAAAIAWAKAQGAPAIAVVGASIGSNSALVAGSRDKDVKLVIALSPGIDYMGIKPGAAIATLGARAVLIAADDDARSASAVRTFAGETQAAATQVLADGGHGNAIMAAHPDLMKQLVDRLAKSLKASP